ncbi:MAG: DMT family transporter [Chloroflexota bacterium]
MSSILLLMLLIAISGIAITLQGHFMGMMDQAMGTRESVFITYFSGALVATAIMLLTRSNAIHNWKSVPWYAYSAGILGLLIVGTIGYVVPRMGLVAGFTVLIAAQFTSSALIDHFGWFGATVHPFGLWRIVGVGVMLVGIWLILR